MIKLTQKQYQTLQFIKYHIKSEGFPPTIVEIANEFDTYPNTAQGHVRALIKKGAMTNTEGKMRSLQPVKGVRVVIK